jgi:uncharacterized membrane protein
MPLDLWLEYILRFSHLVAGIAWIGSSFYFIWLDSSFLPPQSPRANVEGESYMVHGGFYYQVDKRKIYPGELPKILHWFKWEATLTWITGFLLLAVIYFLHGASLMIGQYPLTQTQAIFASISILVGSWFVYDLIWHPDWMKSKALSLILSVFYFGGLIYLNTHLFSGRGAFILTGAILGSLMLLNVWVRILPGQRKMIGEAQAGQVPDYSVSLKSKTRSVHNTYFIFPVLFIMLSNHYPALYSHSQNWLLLIILSISGALVRHTMVTKNQKERWLLLPAFAGLVALIWMTSPAPTAAAMSDVPSFDEVHAIFENRCLQCHSSHPTDDVWKSAPKGVIFETEAQIKMHGAHVFENVVVAKTMPLGNKTQMTDEERAIIGRWLSAQKLHKHEHD